MNTWRRAIALVALLGVGLLLQVTVAGRCCRGLVAKQCCCPRPTASDDADRLARGCCQAPLVHAAIPVGALTASEVLTPPLLALETTWAQLPPSMRPMSPRILPARARAPDRPLWLSLLTLRC